MSACEEHRNRIEAYLSGTITPADLGELVAHAARCADCRAGLDLHRELARVAEDVPEPSEREFRAVRRAVLEAVGARRAPLEVRGPWRRLADRFAGAPLLRPLAFAAVLALAVLAGRWSAAPARMDDVLLRELRSQAATETGLSGYWDAPFSLDNVSVRPRDDGSLELGFDASRHVELVADRNSPLAREALVHAIIDSRSLGMRLRALETSRGMADPRLGEALVFALRNDPEPAVRLQALSLLLGGTDAELARSELLRTLRDDPSVQLRLAALDALAERQIDPERLQQVILTVDSPGEQAILQQAMRKSENQGTR